LHGGGRRFDPGILHLPPEVGTTRESPLVFRRILVATDGTEASLRGVEVAARMVARDQCEMLLLTAVSLPQHVAEAAATDQRAIENHLERMTQEAMAPAIAVLRRMRVGAEIKAVMGPAPEVILAELDFSAADLVVMGRRSRYEPKDFILGSVSYRVAHHVAVPILLVP
jgi:nucleotide-binding universal stress UspA family protein